MKKLLFIISVFISISAFSQPWIVSSRYSNNLFGKPLTLRGAIGDSGVYIKSGTAYDTFVVRGLQSALSGTGFVKFSGSTASYVPQISLTSEVTGRLPYANIVAPTTTSILLGRGTSSGDWQEITLGTNLSITGTTLNASGGGGGSAAGNYGDVQLNRNSTFATPASDSLQFVSGSGLSLTGTLFNGSANNNVLRIRGNTASANTAANPNIIFQVGNVAANDTALTIYNNKNIQLDKTGTAVGSTAPVSLNFGRSYGTNTPGNSGNLKFYLFDDGGSGKYGIGMSSNLMEYQVASGAGHAWFVGGTQAMAIASNRAVTMSNTLGVTGAITGTTTETLGTSLSGAAASPLILDLGAQYGSNSDYSASNIKLMVQNPGYGFAIRPNLMVIHVPSSSVLGIGINGTEAAEFASSGLTVVGNLTLNTAGNKIKITTGTNASLGTATLSSGTVTVSTTAVTASSKIFVTHAGSSVTNAGVLYIGTITAATSFVITSTNASDNDTVNWWIVN